jgi:hypothetical protein
LKNFLVKWATFFPTQAEAADRIQVSTKSSLVSGILDVDVVDDDDDDDDIRRKTPDPSEGVLVTGGWTALLST